MENSSPYWQGQARNAKDMDFMTTEGAIRRGFEYRASNAQPEKATSVTL
jgi:hypothetical protein